jgi:hypothetical protein
VKTTHSRGGNFARSCYFLSSVKHIACVVKVITEERQELYQKLLALRTHGIVKNEELYQNRYRFNFHDTSISHWVYGNAGVGLF